MRLYVTDVPNEIVDIGTVFMTQSEFNCIKSQPFIASSKFDAVVIEVTDKTDTSIIKYLRNVTRVIPKLPEEITSHVVTVLGELYKERSAEIRFTYMKSKDEFNKLIETMKKDYCWEQFY